MPSGLVVKSTGKFYRIENEETGELHDAIIRGRFKLEGFKLTNPVAVGDKVVYEVEDGLGIISQIEERTNYVVRQSPRKKHNLHLIACNIDQAVLVVTVIDPKLKPGFIDRFLVMTEPYDIPVIIVFNKSDLYDEGHWRVYRYVEEIYRSIGYEVYAISAIEEKGLTQVKDALVGKTTLFSGQSGVGKSSVLNAMYPELKIKTKEISDYTGKGQHTTTFAEMYQINREIRIIDTPGIKTLGFNHFEVQDVAHNFREIFKFSEHCKFGDCTHRDEPKCAVKEAVEENVISELRYGNYLRIIQEIEEQNYWELNKDY